VLIDNYFCTYVSYLLNFDIDDVVSFDTVSNNFSRGRGGMEKIEDRQPA